jgi:hypothetical protein
MERVICMKLSFERMTAGDKKTESMYQRTTKEAFLLKIEREKAFRSVLAVEDAFFECLFAFSLRSRGFHH